ncbi:hypothetical protein HK405_008071 [Cladochytrium tenue]|nr:hypothetical protein HK405_008071 [Cladochytrium tenue]
MRRRPCHRPPPQHLQSHPASTTTAIVAPRSCSKREDGMLSSPSDAGGAVDQDDPDGGPAPAPAPGPRKRKRVAAGVASGRSSRMGIGPACPPERERAQPLRPRERLHFDADDDDGDGNDLFTSSPDIGPPPPRYLAGETAAYFASIPGLDGDETETDREATLRHVTMMTTAHARHHVSQQPRFQQHHHQHQHSYNHHRLPPNDSGGIIDSLAPPLQGLSVGGQPLTTLDYVAGPPQLSTAPFGMVVPRSRLGVLSETSSSSNQKSPSSQGMSNPLLPTPSATSASLSGKRDVGAIAGGVVGGLERQMAVDADATDIDIAMRAVQNFERQEPNGLIEIVYVTDSAGNILSLDEAVWNQWMLQNSDFPVPERILRCLAPGLLGRNLFEFIGDPKVQLFARHLLYMLTSNQQTTFQYYWFCDSAELERKMHMTVTRVGSGAESTKLCLWISKIITETILNPPQDYLRSPPYSGDVASTKSRTVCSYCKRIMVICEDMHPRVVDKILSASPDVPSGAEEAGIPFIGLRGKRGLQKVVATDGGGDEARSLPDVFPNHLWLTPNQYYVDAALGAESITIRHGVCEVCYDEVGALFFPPDTFRDGVADPAAAAAAAAAAAGTGTGTGADAPASLQDRLDTAVHLARDSPPLGGSAGTSSSGSRRRVRRPHSPPAATSSITHSSAGSAGTRPSTGSSDRTR